MLELYHHINSMRRPIDGTMRYLPVAPTSPGPFRNDGIGLSAGW